MLADEKKTRALIDKWLAARPGSFATNAAVLAQRSACRILPSFGRGNGFEPPAALTVTVLWPMRLILTAGVCAVCRTEPLIETLSRQYEVANRRRPRAFDPSLAMRIDVAANSARIACDQERDLPEVVGLTLSAIGAAAENAEFAGAGGADIWEQVRNDADLLDDRQSLFKSPLWSGVQPEWFLKFNNEMLDLLREESAGAWGFWVRSWEGVLSGRQLDRNLQEAVALIPDEVWEAGSGAVAEAISTIEERLRLLGEVSALKERLLQLQSVVIAEVAPAERRAHNRPPELIAAEAEAIRDVATLVDALSTAETELKKSTPATPVLRRVVKTILAVTLRLAAYCGGKVDAALTKASEEVGGAVAKWGIGLFGWQVASQIEPLKSLTSALTEFLKRLAEM